MILPIGAKLAFTGYEVHRDHIAFQFTCANPGPGMESIYTIDISNTELQSLTDEAGFDALCAQELERKYRRKGIASKLDRMQGRVITLR